MESEGVIGLGTCEGLRVLTVGESSEGRPQLTTDEEEVRGRPVPLLELPGFALSFPNFVSPNLAPSNLVGRATLEGTGGRRPYPWAASLPVLLETVLLGFSLAHSGASPKACRCQPD